MRISLLKPYFYCVFFSVCLFIINIAQAADIIEKSIQVSANGHVFIKNDRGDVEVIAWDKDEILVKGELVNNGRELIFKNIGEKTYIKVGIREGSHRGNAHSGGDSELKVYVPRNVQLPISTILTI